MYKKMLRNIKMLTTIQKLPLSEAICLVCKNKEYEKIVSFTPSEYITKDLQAVSISSDELVNV